MCARTHVTRRAAPITHRAPGNRSTLADAGARADQDEGFCGRGHMMAEEVPGKDAELLVESGGDVGAGALVLHDVGR